MKEWKFDDDPLVSARLLLSKTTSGEGESCIRVIEFDGNADYD